MDGFKFLDALEGFPSAVLLGRFRSGSWRKRRFHLPMLSVFRIFGDNNR